MNGVLSCPKVLRVKDVQEILQIGQVAAYRLIHSGEFPVIRVGRSYRIPEEEFYLWMRTNFGPVVYPSSVPGAPLRPAKKDLISAIDNGSILYQLKTGGTDNGRK